MCINDLAFNIGDRYLTTIDVKSTFCSKGSDYSCYPNGSISKITVIQNDQSRYFTMGELSCLPYLTFFKGVNIKIEKIFLETINPSIVEMDISSSNIQVVDFIIGPLKQMIFKVTQITPQSIKNIQSFGCAVGLVTIDESNSFEPIPDSVTWNFGCTVNSFPNVTFYPKLTSLSIVVGPQFDESSMSKIMYCDEKITNLQISGDYSISFPIQLSQLLNSKISSMYFSLPFKKPTHLIDLSNLKKVDTIIIFPGMNFNVDGVFPFSKLPQFTSHFQISNGNVSVWPDFNIFKNVKYLEMQNMNIGGPMGINPLGRDSQLYSAYLYNNKITGFIDESWCSVYLTVSTNLLTGSIPDCFYCYLNISSVSSMFRGNNFDNYFPSNVSCDGTQIRPQLSIQSGEVKISGDNIGLDIPSNIVSSSCSSFSFTSPENYYTGSNCDIKDKIEISFIKPGLNFTFSTGTVSPVIYSMIQTNNTFDIDGAYLSYNRSNIMVKIGTLDCIITNDPTTFYKAKCQIDYPIKDEGKQVVSIKVDGLTSSNFTIDLEYTKIPCPVENCNGNGKCNYRTGECICNSSNWLTVGNKICNVTNHYVSSYTQTSTNGGKINFYGHFGLEKEDPSILIDGVPCTITNATETFYECTIDAAGIVGKKNFTLTQNTISIYGLIYPYIDTNIVCPNDCGSSSSMGTCNKVTGECTCAEGYKGFDCSTNIDIGQIPTLKITVPTDKASIKIENEQNMLEITVPSIVEYDYEGNSVGSITIGRYNWKSTSSSSFSQIINNFTISLTIEKITTDKKTTFGNDEFKLESGGVVLSITLENYPYKNTSNWVQVQLVINDFNDNDDNYCSSPGFSTSEEKKIKSMDTVNYIINKEEYNRLLSRFQGNVLSDGRSAIVTNEIVISSTREIVIGINLPHCVHKCITNSDFSLLPLSNFKIDSCTAQYEKTNTEKWLLPVVIIVPIVGFFGLAAAVFIVYKKHKSKALDSDGVSMKSR
ncbi:hypothetical protein ACTFIV_001998 [Dictyostelium citrinum]